MTVILQPALLATLRRHFFVEVGAALSLCLILFCLLWPIDALAQERNWLGIKTKDMHRSVASLLEVPERHGVVVIALIPEGPAWRAGLWSLDVIVAVAGKRILSSGELNRALSQVPANTRVDLTFYRKGQRQTAQAVVERVSNPQAIFDGYLGEADNYYAYGVDALEMGDHTKAFENMSIAGMVGHRGAQFVIAKFFEEGIGVPRDLGAANLFYLLSALNGHAPGSLYLANSYIKGIAVPRDKALAHRWLESAWLLGDQRGKQRLERLDADFAAHSSTGSSAAANTSSTVGSTSTGQPEALPRTWQEQANRAEKNADARSQDEFSMGDLDF